MSNRQWTNKIYDSLRVLAPNGELMHLTREDKVEWYLEHDLAERIDDRTIRLKFTPSGLGHAGHNFYLIPRENRCVVCGDARKLTRHHVVPACYWRHIPKRYKSGSSHDVLATCVECHTTYERAAYD